MAKRLILHGRVQGVFCRAYCREYARRLKIRGSAANLSDGTVRVFLDTDDDDLVSRFVQLIKNNPQGVHFYGRIDSVDIEDYSGPIRGDSVF
ncbi:MAG: acylphosphatase [bacterium]|nr:acylphosphatase [bacterium]